MSYYNQLFNAIKLNTLKKRGLSEFQSDINKIAHGTAYIALLEIYLYENKDICPPQRITFDPNHELHYLIFKKLQWPLDEIRELSLADCLYILHEELLEIAKRPEVKSAVFFDQSSLHPFDLDDSDRNASENRQLIERICNPK